MPHHAHDQPMPEFAWSEPNAAPAAPAWIDQVPVVHGLNLPELPPPPAGMTYATGPAQPQLHDPYGHLTQAPLPAQPGHYGYGADPRLQPQLHQHQQMQQPQHAPQPSQYPQQQQPPMSMYPQAWAEPQYAPDHGMVAMRAPAMAMHGDVAWRPLESVAHVSRFEPRLAPRGTQVAVVTGAVALSLLALIAMLFVLVGGGEPSLGGIGASGGSGSGTASKADRKRVQDFVRNLDDDLVPSKSVAHWKHPHAGAFMTDGARGSTPTVIVSKVDVGEAISNDDLATGGGQIVQSGLRQQHIVATLDSVTPRTSTFGLPGGVEVRMHRTVGGIVLDQRAYLAVDGTTLYMAVGSIRQGDSRSASRVRQLVSVLRKP